MSTKVLNALVLFYFFAFTACMVGNNQSGSNSTIKVKPNSTLAKNFKQARKLENSADHLLNATAKYDKLLDKPLDVDNDPRYADLTPEQKEVVKRVQQKARENLEAQIEKIFNKSESIRNKAAKIEKQLEKNARIAEKAKAIQKSVKNSTNSNRNKTSKSFISTNLKKGPRFDKAMGAAGIAQTCTKSFFESVPPTICWKKGGDVGIIPTGCPPGYFRYLALCFKHCEPGTSFDGGALCIGGCPPGYAVHPLTCYKFPFGIKGRRAYFPKSITNFEAPCQEGYYRGAALCYRDCNKIGMVNCGIGMCAASSEACASGISQMVVDVVSSIGKGVGFVLSFGSSSAATSGIKAAKTAMKKSLDVIKKAAKSAKSIMKRLAGNPKVKQTFMRKAMNAAKDKIKEYAIDKAKETAIEKICGSLHEALFDKVATGKQEEEESKGFSLEKFDVLGVGEIANKCKNPEGTNGGIDCAKSILSTLDNVDPTGLTGLAAAFMQPICDV